MRQKEMAVDELLGPPAAGSGVETAQPDAPSAGAALLARLLALPTAELKETVQGLSREDFLAAFAAGNTAARRAVHSGAQEAASAAEAALRVARLAPRHLLAGCERQSLIAEAWARRANAARLSEQLEKADRAWGTAERAFRACTKERSLRAEMDWLQALLRRAQRRFPEALDLLAKAGTIYRDLCDAQGQARVELATAWVHYSNNDIPAAFLAAVRAGELVNSDQSPENALGAMHLITLCLVDAGELRYAVHYLSLYEPAYALAGGMIEVRSWWLKARMAMAFKRWHAAEGYLEKLRAEFQRRGLDYDAALAGVDLAVCYAEQGKSSAVWLLAQEMYAVFCSKKIPREAAAALLLFADTARKSRPPLGQLIELAGEINRERRLSGR